MAANFLHGVETIEIIKGGRPVKMVKSSVIGLVGTAPIHLIDAADRTVNRPVLILSDTDAAKNAGPERPGFTIPSALDVIRDCGRGVVIMVNVFDPALHKSTVTAEAGTFAANVVQLAHGDVLSLVLKDQAGATTYVAGTDYSFDAATGLVTRLVGGAIAVAGQVKATYDYADLSKVTSAHIIGAVDAAGFRTGMQAWLDSYNLFGFFPKNLLAPVYGTLTAVSTELNAMANKVRGHGFVDAPVGTTFAQAIAGRGPLGTINFNSSSKRMVPCWPHTKRYDPVTDTTVLSPFSTCVVGIMAETDIAEGYWVSPSNREIPGIVGMERPVSAMINDANSEANLANEAGIVTMFNSFGTGIRVWGNRSAAFPSSTAGDNFISVRRTLDVIHESVEYAMLQFLDGPLDAARIDAILATVNALCRKLIADGALIDGRYWFDPAENTVEELSAGHLVLNNDLTPPPPLERITFKSAYSAEGLKKLYSQIAA